MEFHPYRAQKRDRTRPQVDHLHSGAALKRIAFRRIHIDQDRKDQCYDLKSYASSKCLPNWNGKTVSSCMINLSFHVSGNSRNCMHASC